jgi:hypothetical protein
MINWGEFDWYNNMMSAYHDKEREGVIKITSGEEDPYGVSELVPIVFTNGNDGKQISRTPFGKVIFPSTKNFQNNVLYFLNLTHKQSVAFAKGDNYRTETYWLYVLDQKKISAIKDIRATTGWHLRDAKHFVDNDFELLDIYDKDMFSSNPSSPIQTPTSDSFLANTNKDLLKTNAKLSADSMFMKAEIDKLRKEVDNARDSKYREQKMVAQLQETFERVQELVQENETMTERLAKLQNRSPTINVWEIIECNPSTSKEIIQQKISEALHKYHPDKINFAGKLLVQHANKIMVELLAFKKRI